ncbi:MAG: amidohydrolase family protein [Deltaproteobacteria bacterium]|jgi:predicted TIM-barrel fold metal-dependent hydrolase|nr:amidohydrolase family protein [Deltaproteobacteria bacterium]
MKIIDAHIHFAAHAHFDQLAREAGHSNDLDALKVDFDRLGIVGAIVMGNRDLTLESHSYPGFMRYCIGLDSSNFGETAADAASVALRQVELHLQRASCVGLKLYPGYNSTYVYDPMYAPFLELAARYDKPVAIHTGELASSWGNVKYSHPLTVDEVATAHPRTRFVLCHLGNPWLLDAAVVISKNPNVSADLSGFLIGRQNMQEYFDENKNYLDYLKMSLQYMQAWDRLMFATDWPLTNLGDYIEFVAGLIPAKYHDLVFYENAKRIYGLEF